MRASPCAAPVLLFVALAVGLAIVSTSNAHDPVGPSSFDEAAPASRDGIDLLDTALISAPPSPSDGDVEAVLLDGDRILAGTAEGVWSYDGLDWFHHAFADTVRWIERRDGEIWAGGTRGVWTADAQALEFDRSAEGPAGNRCARAEGDTLWVGADAGLFRHFGGRWEDVRGGARVQCLTRYPDLGLIAGTWGEGLWILEEEATWRAMRAPEAGATDTLAGNYIHDLDVGENGDLRIACSWGGLESRLIAHRNARERGWITERDPHDFRRASLVGYDGENWQVTYLFQNYTDSERSRIALYTLYSPHPRLDIDADGAEEWFVMIGRGRHLHPQGLACFDLQSLSLDWFLPLTSTSGCSFIFLRSGEPHLARLVDGSDHGSIVGSITDRQAYLQIHDRRGELLRRFPVPTNARPYLSLESLMQPAVSVDSIRIRAGTRPEQRRAASWTLDLEELTLTPADSVWVGYHPFSLKLAGELFSFSRAAPDLDLRVPRRATGDLSAPLWDPRRIVEDFGQDPGFTMPLVLPGPRLGLLIPGEDQLAVWDGAVVARSTYPSPAGSRRIWWRGYDWRFGLWLTAFDEQDATLEIWRPSPPLTSKLAAVSFVDPSADAVQSLSSISILPISDPSHVQHFSKHFASRVDAQDRFTGWIEARNVGGALPILDPEGQPVDRLPLPEGLRNARSLEWFDDEPTVVGGRAVAAIVDTGSLPFVIHLLDPRQDRWVGKLEVDLPYRDLHLNGISGLDPGGWLVGGESGLRRIDAAEAPADPWKRDARHRIRGIASAGKARVIAWGSAGLLSLPRPRPPIAENVVDLFESDGELYVVEGNRVRVRGAGESSWQTPDVGPHPFTLLAASHFLPGPGGVWVQPRDHGYITQPPAPADGRPSPWPRANSVLYSDGNQRIARAILELDEENWLAATDRGAVLITEPRSSSPRSSFLSSDNISCTSMVRVGAGRVLAAKADGRVLEVVATTPRQPTVDDRSRPRARAVLEMLADGDQNVVWARTLRGLEKWELADPAADQSWTLPDSIETRSLALSSTGGTWLGTTDGIWRLTDRERLLVPAAFDEVEGQVVDRIWETGPDSSRTLAVLSGGVVREFDVGGPEARVRWESDDEGVRIALWQGGPIANPGRVIVETEGEKSFSVRGSVGRDGIGRFRIPSLERGRHQVSLTALDREGRTLGPAILTTVRIWETHTAAALAAVLLPVPPLAVWTFLRRRDARFAGAALAFAVGVPVLLHYGLMFRVPWITVSGVSLSLVLTGVVLLVRDGHREIPAPEAIHRLSLLLSAFRHRGRGISPVSRLLIVARNAPSLAEAGDDLVGETQTILREVLVTTDELEAELPHLVHSSGIRSPLLRRLQRRLEELRETAADLVEDRARLLRWCADVDERLATQELCHSFVRSVAAASQLLRRHDRADLPELLQEFCESRRVGASVDLHIDEGIGEVPVPASGLIEILENLESNAFRANGGTAPRIVIEVSRLSGDDVELAFEDDGPGVPADDRERIFEDGWSGTGSTGTGLTRCRTLARAWGATLHCEDPVDRDGARFVLRIPVGGGA